MLRLIKLAVYAGAAFAIYEIVQGMLDQEHPGSRRGPSDLNRALNSESGRLQALTGPGLGHRMETLDNHGGSVPHQVGRGALVQ